MSYPNPMERVFYTLHHQVCTQALVKTSSKTRNLAERFVLILSVCGFGALLLAHVSFVYRGNTSTSSLSTTISDGKPLGNIPVTCLSTIEGFSADADILHLSLLEDEGMPSRALFASATSTSENQVCGFRERGDSRGSSCINESALRVLFSYSKVEGFLLLPNDVCKERGLKVQHVIVSKHDVRCFGEPFLQKLIFRLIGPDTVMSNWLLAWSAGNGFVYNPRTEVMIDLRQYNSADTTSTRGFGARNQKYGLLISKLAVVLKTSFLFFITTTLVSFTLRETQERMLDFTHQLQAHVRSHRPVAQLVTTHLVENLVFVPIMVGMIFFLIEFYRGDKFLAFMVVSLVWLCEVFSVISLRSSQGIHFFPRIFFLLFSLFHFYLFLFPFGFAYTALATTVSFMTHSMLFFWHRYELPAVANGLVTVEQPRMGVASPSPASIPSLESEQRDPVSGPAMPVINLPRRHQLVRQHSTTTASSGRMSRPTSSGGLFHRGDEDDGDGSYLYFMDGEVVRHMHAQSVGSGSGHAASMDESQRSGGSRSRDHTASSNGFNNDIPQRISTGPIERSSFSSTVPPRRNGNTVVLDDHQRVAGDGRIGFEDPPETSALQAILQANNTPRTDNLSQDARYDNDHRLVQSAPSFPSLSDSSDAQ